jgi:hypothetical protein
MSEKYIMATLLIPILVNNDNTFTPITNDAQIFYSDYEYDLNKFKKNNVKNELSQKYGLHDIVTNILDKDNDLPIDIPQTPPPPTIINKNKSCRNKPKSSRFTNKIRYRKQN